VCVCVSCVLYCTLYYITSFYFMHVNHQYVVSDSCVSELLPFPIRLPSPPTVIVIGRVSFDVLLQQLGMKGQKLEYRK
jgi:hypothetical protein